MQQSLYIPKVASKREPPHPQRWLKHLCIEKNELGVRISRQDKGIKFVFEKCAMLVMKKEIKETSKATEPSSQ